MSEEDEEKFYRNKIADIKIMFKWRKNALDQELKSLKQMEDLIFLAEGELDMKFQELESIINLSDIKFKDE